MTQAHRFLARRWRLLVALALAGLTANVWLHDGLRALLVLIAASTAVVVVVASQVVITGRKVVSHSLRTEQDNKAIEADRASRKELTR